MARGVATLVACRYDKCWSGLCNTRIHCECLWWLGGLVSLSTCVCMSPLPAAIKGKRGEKSFPGEGVHVDTVAVSLFLVCIWNFLVGGGGRVSGWQRFRKRELPHSEKRRKTDRQTTLATAVVWHQGSHSPRCCLGCLTWPGLTQSWCEDTITECFRAPLGNVYLCCLSNQMELPSNHQHQVKVWALSAFSIHYFCPFQAQPNPLRSTTELHSPWQLQPRQPRAERHQGALPWRRGRWQASLRSAGQAVLQVVLQ